MKTTVPHILLIEDNKDFRKATKDFLQLHHIKAHIVEALTGEEGVFLALQMKPEIVITDFSLGEGAMNGLEAAQQIKTYFPYCTIVMLTLWDSSDIAPKDKSRAIDYFIRKGDLYEDLLPSIKKALKENRVGVRSNT